MDLSGTFDSTNALSGMFLWLIFGYLTALLNCDLQRWLTKHPYFIHAFAIVAFFFLFTLLDSNNKTKIHIVWFKTVMIYVLFLMMTKSKWYFVIPVLALLLIDQSFKKDLGFRKASGIDTKQDEIRQKNITKITNSLVIAMTIAGTIHYAYLQKIEYKNKFSWMKFFFSINDCKHKTPDYSKFNDSMRR